MDTNGVAHKHEIKRPLAATGAALPSSEPATAFALSPVVQAAQVDMAVIRKVRSGMTWAEH